jgi:predicted dehydrogenase
MMEVCSREGVRLLVHENFRWQAPLRAVRRILNQGIIGEPFKCRLSYLTGYPVFANQPALRELSDMIIADLGSHQFDIARFLFGEVSHLYCQIQSINEGIKGEDVANALVTHRNGVQTFVEMSFATFSDPDPFPQTLLFIEGREGSIRLEKDFRIRISTRNSVKEMEAAPVSYPWANPDYAVVHSSIVDCNRNLLDDLAGRGKAETDARDNYKTMQLVNAAYESARNHKVVFIEPPV